MSDLRHTERMPSTVSQATDASRFVRALDGGLIDVSEISPEDRYARGPYTCLACGHLMVPALGRTRKHHFKHKAGRPADCHGETYLHQLAKLALYTGLSAAMREGRPYPLTRAQPVICSYYEDAFGLACTGKRAALETDLAAMFDWVEMEAGAGGFVADVLLSSRASGERMLLEVAVSHSCDEEKIASGLPIVEIDIRSEAAAGRLARGIDTTSGWTRCHNLPDPEPVPHRCTTPCSATGLVALLYENGKVWYSETEMGKDKELLSDPRLVAHEVVDVRLGRPSRTWAEIVDYLGPFMIRHAFKVDRPVRSCLLCWNNGGRVNEHDIFCMAKNHLVWMSSSASGCSDYEPAADAEEAEQLLDGQVRDVNH